MDADFVGAMILPVQIEGESAAQAQAGESALGPGARKGGQEIDGAGPMALDKHLGS
jgi:hypothetical protein